jgi:hypothetical protein
VFDEWPRSLGALVPELGDGMYRASIEGDDGEIMVWVHLVAYGPGREQLSEVSAHVDRELTEALKGAAKRA